MSRLRRLVVSDRYFFVTCNLLRARNRLDDDDFEVVARVIAARRREHGFLLTAWAFLADHWHAILGVRYPKAISVVMEAAKVSGHGQSGSDWPWVCPSRESLRTGGRCPYPFGQAWITNPWSTGNQFASAQWRLSGRMGLSLNWEEKAAS